MSPIMSQVEIARPCHEIFAYATDPTRFAVWQDDVVSARMVEGGEKSEVGARFTTVRRVGPGKRAMTQEITESTPPTHWAAHGVDGPVRPSVVLDVEPLEDNSRSRVTFRMDFEAHGLGRLIVPLLVRPMAARRAPRSYQRLKERLEGSARPTGSAG
jgi:hypothetical protein